MKREQKILFYIIHNYLRNVNLRQLKEELRLGPNPTEIFSAFYDRYGLMPMQMMAQRRLRYACKKLLHSRQPVAEIAELMGCRSTEHFEKEFEDGIGVTPLEYRNRIMQKAEARKARY